MTKLSISRAWDETRGILARDGKLISTVALALFVLPGLVADLAAPRTDPGELPGFGPGLILGFIAVLIAMVGQLALVRLAIGPSTTVGAAIGHGGRRTPAYLAATFLWLLPFLLIFGALVGNAGGSLKNVSAAGALGLLLLVPVLVFFAVRFLLIAPVSSSEPVGPLGILKRSWSLTAGHWWRLFGFLVLLLIAAAIVVGAVGAIAGLIARIVLGGTDPMTLGGFLVSLVGQLVSAAVSVVLMVMLARIYTQLSGQGAVETSVPSSAE